MGTASRLLGLALHAGATAPSVAQRLTASLLHGQTSSWSNSSYLVHQWRLLAAASAQTPACLRTSVQRAMSSTSGSPQLVSIRDQWSRYQAQLSCLWAGLSSGTAGQKVLIGLLPLAIVTQLFPGRFQGLALEIAPNGQPRMRPAYMVVAQPPSLYSQLLTKTGLPVLIKQIYEELQIWLRGIYLGFLFMPAVATGPAAFWAGGAARAAWMHLMTWTLENAGPAFIKWGQWSSTRPDLFPPDLCQAMERLQTSAPAHSPAYSRARVAKSLSRPLNVLFEEFDDEPVASGSIAQIHRATLSAAGAALTAGRYPKGTCVAVKVRHPGVTTVMQHDFVLMERAARMLSAVPGLARLRLDESIRQFGGPLKEQLDLAVEAQHLLRFKHNFRLWPNVSFPTPLYPLVSSDVLVETFEDGALISKYVNQPTYAHRFSLAETGLTCYLQMLLRDNFIHADLHPGNILVKEADVRKATGGGLLGWLRASWPRSPPKLVLLDTGMIAELTKTDQGNLISFFKALTKQDGEMLGNAILDMSERYTCKDPDAFISEIKSMFDRLDPDFIHRHTATVIESIIDTIREHQVTLRSAVSTVVVTTLVLEGWSSKLNPDMRILDFMRDMLLVDWNERISRTVDNIMTNGSLAVV